jgi:hypothetical protein
MLGTSYNKADDVFMEEGIEGRIRDVNLVV